MVQNSDIEKQVRTLKNRLTIRYAVALGLIASTLVVAFLLLQTQLKQSEKDAYIINTSGMQRMLSQRIALFSREIYHERSNEQAPLLAAKMEDAYAAMLDNHNQLTSGRLEGYSDYVPSEAIKDLYYGEVALDARVREYLDLTHSFITTYQEAGFAAVREAQAMGDITRIARNGLLDDLNSIVYQHQREAEDKIAYFKKTEIAVVVTGLLLLLLEVLFVFRPMVAQVSKSIGTLKSYNNELLEFSYRISHDLRAPIVSSLGLIEVAKAALKNQQLDTSRTAMDHIESSMVRLDALVNDLITLTKCKLVDVKPEIVYCDVLIEEILHSLSSLEGYENIDVRLDIQLQGPVYMKKMIVQQNIENLISNSIKYADHNKKRSFIDLTIAERHDKLHITVVDNGLGIPEEFRERLFNMFERFHPEHSFGSGLGLYLVYQNAKMLGGEMRYSPTEDGSLFKMIIPQHTDGI